MVHTVWVNAVPDYRSRLKREVIAPDGPDRHDAVAAYRRRRNAVKRGKKFLTTMRRMNYLGCAVDPGDVIDEIDRLIEVLEETL